VPPKGKLVKDGTISKARVRLGVAVFRELFKKLVTSFKPIKPDFHGLITVVFDGTTGSMPDTAVNEEKFGKPKSGKKKGPFPRLRLMSLLAVSGRLVLDVAYAAYCGKGTGERALMLKILEQLVRTNLLFLQDAGLYAFYIVWEIEQKGQKFIIKLPKGVKPKPIKYLPDGSYLAELKGKIEDPEKPSTKDGRKRWQEVKLMVRVIEIEIPGFRPHRLITNLLDEEITARELALHYHQRWDIEISYDEIKTHQCATLRGQCPTTFRSKRPDLVEQELYAMLIMYNLIRGLIFEAAREHHKDPRFISFLDALQHMIDAAPFMTALGSEQREAQYAYLLAVIADCDIDRPRRARLNPRVVKIKTSKFRRKGANDRSQKRDLAQKLKIIDPKENLVIDLSGVMENRNRKEEMKIEILQPA
jgi:hypothetical protein